MLEPNSIVAFLLENPKPKPKQLTKLEIANELKQRAEDDVNSFERRKVFLSQLFPETFEAPAVLPFETEEAMFEASFFDDEELINNEQCLP